MYQKHPKIHICTPVYTISMQNSKRFDIAPFLHSLFLQAIQGPTVENQISDALRLQTREEPGYMYDIIII